MDTLHNQPGCSKKHTEGRKLEVKKKTIDDDEVLLRREAAQLLKTPMRTLDYLVATGQIPFSRISKRSVRFTRSRLMRWLEEREGIEYRMPRAADGASANKPQEDE